MTEEKDIDREGFKERMTALVREAGSQVALARRARVPQQNISNWLGGKVPIKTVRTVFARNLGVSEEWLFHGIGPRERAEDLPLRVAEEDPEREHIQSAIRFICEKGDAADVRMLKEMVAAAEKRVRARAPRS